MHRLRTLAWRVVPAYMADRAVRYERTRRARLGSIGSAGAFAREHGATVQAGPVAGLLYWPDGDAAIAKLVGSYELEIHPWLAAAAASA